jgi:hypothetical protein
MAYSQRVDTANTYALFAVALTAVVGIVLMIIGAGVFSDPMIIVGIVLLFVALASFLTTAERIRHKEYSGARGPLMAWGIVAIVFSALVGALLFNMGGGLFFLSFGQLLAGILFFLSHSQMIPPSAEAGGIQRQPSARPRADQPRTELTSDTTLIGIASLQCKNGTDRGSTFRLGKGRATVGRGEGNDVNLEDLTVSRTHAEITYDGKNFAINDLGSSNGTYVDGTAVPAGQPRKLRDGAQVKLGEETFLFSTEEKTQLVDG